MSKEAMDWALELAPPMPAQLVATLSGLARHADKHGKGAFPSVARLAAYTCKAERSIQRDLKQLRELGLIRLGDQTKVSHLPEGKRPEVYDLALERVVPGGRASGDEVTRASRVTLASSRRRGGKKKPSSDEFSDSGTGDVDVTPDVDVTGDVDVADGVTSTSQEGRRPRHPNQKKNRTDEGGRASARGTAASAGSNDGAFAPIDENGGFALNDVLRRWAKRDGYSDVIDIDYATAQFVDHFRANGQDRSNWNAEWQKWIRREAKFAAERRRNAPKQPPPNSNPHDEWMYSS